MITVGDTTITFSDIETNDSDSSASIRVVKGSNTVTGRFVFSDVTALKKELFELASSKKISWKSDCEDLIVSKSFDNGLELVKIELCVDSEDSDEYWNINIVSATGKPIEINPQKIEEVFG